MMPPRNNGGMESRFAPAELDGFGSAEGSLAVRGLGSGVRARGGGHERKGQVKEEDDIVRMYLTDIGQYSLLTKDDEARLGAAVVAGAEARGRLDEATATGTRIPAAERRDLQRQAREADDATREFVQSNLRLVVSIAKKYQTSGLPLLDLVQEGNLGLIHAVGKFDYTKGFKFSTYATWWIRQAITRGIANTGRTIRHPVHTGDEVGRLRKATGQLEEKYGRKPTVAELADTLDWNEEKVAEFQQISALPISLDEPLADGSDQAFHYVVADRRAIAPDTAAEQAMLPSDVEKMLAQLDERERIVLRLRHGLDGGGPRTLEEVGAHFNLTRERVRQIENRAMSKLRHPSAGNHQAKILLS